MTKLEFIEKVSVYVKTYASKYGIKLYSPIIAQACLESSYGTSNKAKYHNYFGLKYRKNRVTCHSGYFNDNSKEQKANGNYKPINTDWYAFKNMEKGIEGYFQFINIENYSNLKGVTNPKEYLEKLKEDNYATDKNYVNKNMEVIEKWNLTKYDIKKYYRVQAGAYSNKTNAEKQQKKIKDNGFDCIIKEDNNIYKCQIGCYSNKDNAEDILNKIKKSGISAIIVYC